MSMQRSIVSRTSTVPRTSLAPLYSPRGQASSSTSSSTAASTVKSRHLSHLHSQLAQLSANLADLENLLRQTAVQAESMKGLGGWSGGLLMAASKILGEETAAQMSSGAAVTHGESGESVHKDVRMEDNEDMT